MDTHKCAMPAENCPMASLQGKRILAGAKQIRKAILSGSVRLVILAQNADPALTDPLEALCLQNHIPVSRCATMAQLGKLCGIEVPAAAAAVAK